MFNFNKIKGFVMFRKSIILFGLLLGLVSFNSTEVKAEVIDNVIKEIKKFDDWRVMCDNDVMLEEIRCKIAARFYNNTSSIYVQPKNKYANQIVIIIPPAVPVTKVKIKVGKNDVVESQEIRKDDFGVVPMESKTRKMLLKQMKTEKEYLYIRFTVKDEVNPEGVKEITERISMRKFNEMLLYHEDRGNLYSMRYQKRKVREGR
jgi:hypothetical protein